jgi:hypothetical protein
LSIEQELESFFGQVRHDGTAVGQVRRFRKDVLKEVVKRVWQTRQGRVDMGKVVGSVGEICAARNGSCDALQEVGNLLGLAIGGGV